MALHAWAVETHSEIARQLYRAERGVEDWIQIVRGGYLEVPGLRLTRGQVQRLWGLDAALCDKILEALVRARFLQPTGEGAFAREPSALARV